MIPDLQTDPAASPDSFFDPVLDALCQKVNEASSTTEAGPALDEMLRYCEKTLVDASDGKMTRVLFEVAYVLAGRPGDPRVWEFLRRLAGKADQTLRDVMRMALLELVPENPVRIPDLERLWSLHDDESTRWAVEAAYLHAGPGKMEHDRQSCLGRREPLGGQDF